MDDPENNGGGGEAVIERAKTLTRGDNWRAERKWKY